METMFLAAEGTAPFGGNIVMLVLIALMFVLLFVLPSRRQKKYLNELKQRQSQMTPGTEVKTNWGLYGSVVSVNQEAKTAQLKIADNTVITVDLSFVTEIVTPTAVADYIDGEEQK